MEDVLVTKTSVSQLAIMIILKERFCPKVEVSDGTSNPRHTVWEMETLFIRRDGAIEDTFLQSPQHLNGGPG